MKVGRIFLFFFTASMLFFACGKDRNPYTPNSYSKGVFVANEGLFGSTGTISWYNPDTGEAVDSIYEKANNGASLGQIVQSIAFDSKKAYLVVNLANRVVIVDRETFVYQDTIGGLEQPRFFLPLGNGFAYISQWGADGLTGSIAKVDLATNEIVQVIPTGSGPEKMALTGGRVYVANSGGYGQAASYTEIDIASGTAVTKPVSAGVNPATLAVDDAQSPAKIYYLAKGYYLDPVPVGVLNEITDAGPGIEVPAYSDDLVRDPDSGILYFIGGGSVWAYQNNGVQKLFDQDAYGLGYDPIDNLLYCADAKGFTGAGEVVVYKTDGTRVGTFRTGVGPGEVVIVK